MIRTIRIPQSGVNDQSAKIVNWLVEDGGYCEKDNAVCEVETTKALIDVPADRSGIVLHLANVGEELAIGEVIGLIGDNIELLRAEQEKYKVKAVEVRATDKARALAESRGVDLSQIKSEGIIREVDVLAHIEFSTPRTVSVNPRGLVIYGAGKGAANIAETLMSDGVSDVACFVDDTPSATELHGRQIYHSSRLSELYEFGCRTIFIAFAKGKKRVEVLKALRKFGWQSVNVCGAYSFVSASALIGTGNQIKAGAVIDTHSTVGDCCIIDNNVSIPHDVTIGNGVHVAPGATLGSSITIGDYAIIGIGASIATGIKIGVGAIVGVGSAVTNDVGDGEFVEGVPAKVVGRHRE